MTEQEVPDRIWDAAVAAAPLKDIAAAIRSENPEYAVGDLIAKVVVATVNAVNAA